MNPYLLVYNKDIALLNRRLFSKTSQSCIGTFDHDQFSFNSILIRQLINSFILSQV